MLEIINFKKICKWDIVPRIHDMHIKSGIDWVRGTNGSGKSTFLKAVAGIISFEEDLILDSNISIKKKSVAYHSLVNFAEVKPKFPDFLSGYVFQ